MKRFIKLLPGIILVVGIIAVLASAGASDYAASAYLPEPSWVSSTAWQGIALIGIGAFLLYIKKDKRGIH